MSNLYKKDFFGRAKRNRPATACGTYRLQGIALLELVNGLEPRPCVVGKETQFLMFALWRVQFSDKPVKYLDLLICSAVIGFFLVVNHNFIDQLVEDCRVKLFDICILAYHIDELSRTVGIAFQLLKPY